MMNLQLSRREKPLWTQSLIKEEVESIQVVGNIMDLRPTTYGAPERSPPVVPQATLQ